MDMDVDSPPLLEAAAELASHPGVLNDEAVKHFLDRFPLPVIFHVLQTKEDVPGVEDTLVPCLDKIFRTKYGAGLLPNYALFIQAGLQAYSQAIRCLSCKAVSSLLVNASDKGEVLQIIVGFNIYQLLISCLIDGDEQTSKTAIDAIKSIAELPEGISIIFPADGEGSLQLKDVAASSSSLARVRVLSLIAKLFSISSSVATAIFNSNLLNLFEMEIKDGQDMLTTLNALELLYELVESSQGGMLLLKTSLLQLLTSMICDSSADSILRSRAALISGRLLSSSDALSVVDNSGVMGLVSAIDRRLVQLESENADEVESVIEALGLTGTTVQGAKLLLTGSTVARHVVELAFERQNRGKQMAALLALGSICGAERTEDSILLDDEAEERLKRLIYSVAANSPKLNPSGLFLSVLQQEPDIRITGYRLISVLVVRPWCLMEVCSKQEIINIVTDAHGETTKIGMEARHHCCKSISNALSRSTLHHDATITGVARKLLEAVKRGPYLAKQQVEAQPVVMTEQRF